MKFIKLIYPLNMNCLVDLEKQTLMELKFGPDLYILLETRQAISLTQHGNTKMELKLLKKLIDKFNESK